MSRPSRRRRTRAVPTRPLPRRSRPPRPSASWWNDRVWALRAGIAVALLLVALAVAQAWLHRGTPQPDAQALRADIVAHRSGAEVTFWGTVLTSPEDRGTHEVLSVSDGVGDTLELDYNTDLGPWIPAHPGDRLLIHGQLYLDPDRVGVHCLHARTSSGCPEPGWIQLGGHTYS
jgi:hypothetical protein